MRIRGVLLNDAAPLQLKAEIETRAIPVCNICLKYFDKDEKHYDKIQVHKEQVRKC
jgi:hypothetical protein